MAKLVVEKAVEMAGGRGKTKRLAPKCWRLPGFDYSRPYYYMVTLKRLDGLLPLSAIVAPGRCQMSAITRAFVHVIRCLHEQVTGLCPIECFTVMPDHLHLLIKIAGEVEGKTLSFRSTGKTLGFYVEELSAALSRAYWEVCAKAGDVRAKRLVLEARETNRFAPVFSPDWHDWIVKCEGQLAEFTRYIRENPGRSWLRASHREYFQRVNEVEFLGRKWYGYGNAALLKLPVLEPMRYSRKLVEGGAEWNAAVARAERIGPGGAGVGTFMSPCEKACGHALGLAGGRWVVLSPEGFGERWHPGRQYERFCAEGRMLFLSLWPAMAREPTRAELYARCHQMGDIVVEGLKRVGAPRIGAGASRIGEEPEIELCFILMQYGHCKQIEQKGELWQTARF